MEVILKQYQTDDFGWEFLEIQTCSRSWQSSSLTRKRGIISLFIMRQELRPQSLSMVLESLSLPALYAGGSQVVQAPG